MQNHEIDYRIFGEEMQFVEVELDYNETLMFSDAENRTFKDVMKEIAEFENIQKNRRKKK